MKISHTYVRKELAKIVKQASRMMEKTFTITEKDSSSNIVTSTDLKIQNFLQKRLCRLITGSCVLGEEGDKLDKTSDYLWIVDPIDGTMNFSRGIPESAISVALLEKEEVVIGLVYNPFQKRMYWAEKGKGAFCNGKRLHVSNVNFEKGLFCTALSLYQKAYAKQCMDVISEVYEQCNDIRRFGTCALELCYLAEGKCDLYYEFRVFPWDYAAACLILQEAGGIIGGHRGEKLYFEKATPIIAANTVENYNRLVNIVTNKVEEVPYEEIFRCLKRRNEENL